MNKLNNRQIDKYRNDPIIHKFVSVFVNMMITNGYGDEDMGDILRLCRHRYNEEIKLIVKGANELSRNQWE